MQGTAYMIGGVVAILIGIVLFVVCEWFCRRKKKEIEELWKR